MLAKYRRIQLLTDYIDRTEEAIKEYNREHDIDNSILVNGSHQTNLGVFRAYLNHYLRQHPGVNHDMTCMVRQLQPTDRGIPLELYFFSSTTVWIPYESSTCACSSCLPVMISRGCFRKAHRIARIRAKAVC